MIFLYHPGTSVLHRLPAGLKLLFLAGLAVWVFMAASLPALALTAGLILVGGRTLGPPARVFLGQARAPASVLALLVTANAVFFDLEAAALVGLRLGTLMAAAIFVTATTRTTDLLEVIEAALAPLDRRGIVNAQKISLALSLTIRLVPFLFDEVRMAREAQIARGAPRHVLALTTPLLVRILKAADTLADAIDARGFPAERRTHPRERSHADS